MYENVGPTNILLVDDRPDGLIALEAALRTPDYNLVTASSGEEALKRLLEEDFALILLDVQMPNLDGLETASIIRTRQRSRSIPIIFITATSRDDPHVLRGYESGAVDYIFKPFDPAILRSKVRIFVELYRQRLEIKRQAELLREAEQRRREELLARLELESFQRYRDLAEAMPHMVWRADPDGAADYFNRLWTSYTGLSVEQSSGSGWRAMIHPEDLPKLSELWESVRRNRGDGFGTECRVKRADGSYRWHIFRVVAERSRSGRLNSWIGSVTDIHHRKEAEDEMCRARELATEASRVKSEFLANMSHEIRTPINGITGMAALLADTALDSEQRECVKTILSSGNALLSVVNDVLDFSRIDSNHMTLESLDFPLRPIIDDSAATLEPKAREKKLALVTYVDPALPSHVRGDPRRVSQIVLNLIGNAIKFTEKGSVVVRAVRDANGADGRLHVRFSVQDTGIGVSEAMRPRLFQPFWQADGSTARKYGGTGLGLTICKNLVELMEGQIGADPRPEGGSTFWFTVPFQAAGAPSAEVPTRPDLGDLRVLIVDDDPAVGQVIRSYLDAWGVRSDAVTGGAEALASLRFGALVRDPYDVALIDYAMPGLDGLETAHRIRADAEIAGTRLILLTAEHDRDLGAAARDAGCSGLLLKPFRQARLLESLQEALDTRLKASS